MSDLVTPPLLAAHEPIPGADPFPCCAHCDDDYMCGRAEGHTVPCVDGCNDEPVASNGWENDHHLLTRCGYTRQDRNMPNTHPAP